MFFIDKSKITLDCFTTSSLAHEYFPISLYSEFIPEWWKKLPNTFEVKNPGTLKNKAATMKGCPGVIKLFNRGFVIPNFSELSFEIKKENNQNNFYYEFAGPNPKSHIDLHDHRQYLNAFNNNYIQAKITLPWLIREKTGVNFIFLEPTWSMIDPNSYMIPPGILDFKYQNNINVNFFIELKENRVDIPAGFPLAHLIPISDKKIKIKTHLISDSEYQKMFELSQGFSWIGSHKKRKHLIDKKTKCPFGFK